MNLYFIRHGMTAGNKKRQYIGVTDEPLCQEGIETMKSEMLSFCKELRDRQKSQKTPIFLFASPLLRCRQTANILFPNAKVQIIPELSEMNFGVFEGKNHEELIQNVPQYQDWLDSRCEAPVPEGESKAQFTKRCVNGFHIAMRVAEYQMKTETANESLLAEKLDDSRLLRSGTIVRNAQTEAEADVDVVFVVHGGTIMAILSEYVMPRKEYYEWSTANGHGYCGKWQDGAIRDIRAI